MRALVSVLAAALVALASCAYHGTLGGFGGAGSGTTVTAPAPPTNYDPPATPSVTVLIALDTSTVKVNAGPFNGDQDDVLDSIHVQLSSAQAFTDTLIDSLTATSSQRSDTLASNADLTEDSTYWVRWRDHGANGGWSAWSTAVSYANTTQPAQITTLSVVAQADDSLKLQWVTVQDGQGNKANHITRYNTPTVDWGGQFEYDNQLVDSLGTNIGDTVTKWVTGLSSATSYQFQQIAYRGEPEVDAVYGDLSNIAGGTTTGAAQDTTDTPVLTLTATADTSSIQMNGSGFVGGSQTHDSTQWRLDNTSDMSSPFYTATSASDLTSHLATDNANLDADATVYGDVRYFGSLDVSNRSAIKSVVNSAPGGACGGVGEPAGFTVVRTHDGTAIELPGWTENLAGPSFHTIEDTVPSAPDGDNTIYRRTYPSGMTLNGAGTDFVFTSGGVLGGSEVFFRVWFRPDPDWLGHPSTVNKLLYWGSGGVSQENVMFALMRGSGTGTLRMEVRRQFPSPAGVYQFHWNDGANLASPTASQASISRGAWNELRVWQRANTPGNANGDLKYWLNGVLIGDFEGFEFFNGSTTRGWKNDGIYGGSAAGTLSQTQTMDYDDICISVLN